MLAGDFLTYQTRADRSGGSALCRSCPESSPKKENLNHILTECLAYAEIRDRIFPEFSKICKTTKSNASFEDILQSNEALCQFILDPTSLNLEKRVNINDPVLPELFRLSRDYCFAVNSIRINKITTKKSEEN